MALTEEQQAQVDLETAIESARYTASGRNKEHKLEALRMAQTVINENRRLTAVADATDVTASDITTMADSLLTYVNS